MAKPGIASLWQRPHELHGTVGHRAQADPAQQRHVGHQPQSDPAYQAQRRESIGKETHEQIGGDPYCENVKPAFSAVAPGDHHGVELRVCGIHQCFNIPPAEVQPLPAHGMAAMRRFADQDPASATEPSCQLPLLRKSSRSVKQKIGFQPLGKNGGKLIEKYGSAESRALFTAFKRSTPNNLGRSMAKGQHCKGTFRSEQFKGCCIVGAT